MTELPDQEPLHALTADERCAIDASIEDAKREEFASEEEVAAVWAKHGL